MRASRRRKLAIPSLVLAAAMMLAACGSTATTSTTSKTSTTSSTPKTTASAATGAAAGAGHVTLKIWTIWGNDPGKHRWIQSVANAYMKAHPNVTIDIRYFSDGAKGQLYQNLRTIFQSGGHGGPDIYTIDPRPYQDIPWQHSGWLANLKGKLDVSHFTPSFLQPLNYKGGIWGVPIEAFANLIYYNKALFKKWDVTVPANGKLDWSQFQAVAAKAKAAGIYPMTIGTQNLAVFAEWWPFAVALRSAGAAKMGGLSPWINTTKWTDPALVKGLQLAKDTIDQGYYPPNVASLTFPEAYSQLFNGKAAMEDQGPWLIATAAAPASAGGAPKGFQLGVMQVPTVPGGAGNNAIEVGTGSCWGVSSFSKHKATAVSFLNFASTAQWGANWMKWALEPTGIKVSAAAAANLPPIMEKQLEWIKQGQAFSPPMYMRFSGTENDAVERDLQHFFSKGYSVQQMTQDLAKYQKGS